MMELGNFHEWIDVRDLYSTTSNRKQIMTFLILKSMHKSSIPFNLNSQCFCPPSTLSEPVRERLTISCSTPATPKQ